jgi:hypothetical protein
MASAFYGSLAYVGYLAFRHTLHEDTASCGTESDGPLEAAQPRSGPMKEEAEIA